MMRVAIGSDHAGFALKEAVKAFLTEEHREVLDLGIHSSDPVDYSDNAEAVGRALRENRVERAEQGSEGTTAELWLPWARLMQYERNIHAEA